VGGSILDQERLRAATDKCDPVRLTPPLRMPIEPGEPVSESAEGICRVRLAAIEEALTQRSAHHCVCDPFQSQVPWQAVKARDATELFVTYPGSPDLDCAHRRELG